MSTQTQATREAEGSVDQIGGKMKQTVGEAKGDRTLALEGKVQGALGRVRKKSAELVARVTHAVRQATESAEHRLDGIADDLDDVGREDTGRERIAREDTGRERIAREDTREDTGRERIAREDTGREDTGREEIRREDIGREDTRPDVKRRELR